MNYRSPWPVIVQVAAAFALVMGIGRFVYTPILPLMTAQTDLTASGAALLATMNYVGYLVGAAAGIVWPWILNSPRVLKVGLAASVIAVLLMPVTEVVPLWGALRLVSGIASAVIFMAGVAALMFHLGPSRAHLSGWGMAGVGIGIALSGALVLLMRSIGSWQSAWWASATLGAVLAAAAWRLVPERPSPAPSDATSASAAPSAASTSAAAPAPATPPASSSATLPAVASSSGAPRSATRASVTPSADGRSAVGPRRRRSRWNPWFVALVTSYTLEGIGYIVAGTFLVAAIDERAAAWVGSSAWILVGVSSSVAVVIWVALSRRIARTTLLAAALACQLVGVTLPAVSDTAGSALVAAVLFGGTFVPIAILAIGIGAELGLPRGVAILTTGYSVGQILGPLLVAPLLDDGYVTALLVGAGFVLASLVTALLLRIRFPVAAAA